MQVNEVVVNGVKELSLVNDTVSEDNLLEGETAHDASGKQITGKVVVTPVDSELNAESENAIQNKAVAAGINNAVNGVKEYANGIISNPNLLINPDFSINQRGQSEYTTHYSNSVDGWIVGFVGSKNTGGYASDTKTLKSNTVETNGYYTYLGQFIEKPSRLAGKEVTFSVAFAETHNLCMIQVWRKSNEVTTSVAATSYGAELFKTLTFTVPEDITNNDVLQFIIQTRGTSVLDWAKLEVGSVATAFVPPNPAVELAKCQRYFYRVGQESGNVHHGVGISSSTGRCLVTMPTPVTMRINPTVTITGNAYLANGKATNVPVKGIAASFKTGANASDIQLYVDTESGALVVGDAYLLRTESAFIDFSADL
jgi:hypothetical protein